MGFFAWGWGEVVRSRFHACQRPALDGGLSFSCSGSVFSILLTRFTAQSRVALERALHDARHVFVDPLLQEWAQHVGNDIFERAAGRSG
jgi:hypothetical protein